jgi:hypothetical protein
VDDTANFRKDFLPVGSAANVAAIDLNVGVLQQTVQRDLGNCSVSLRAEVIEHQHMPALLDERPGNMRTDEAKTAGD